VSFNLSINFQKRRNRLTHIVASSNPCSTPCCTVGPLKSSLRPYEAPVLDWHPSGAASSASSHLSPPRAFYHPVASPRIPQERRRCCTWLAASRLVLCWALRFCRGNSSESRVSERVALRVTKVLGVFSYNLRFLLPLLVRLQKQVALLPPLLAGLLGSV
jgi:hypothetical protein